MYLFLLEKSQLDMISQGAPLNYSAEVSFGGKVGKSRFFSRHYGNHKMEMKMVKTKQKSS